MKDQFKILSQSMETSENEYLIFPEYSKYLCTCNSLKYSYVVYIDAMVFYTEYFISIK